MIGPTTIDKFSAHAGSLVTENVTRACNKCYKKYTRPIKRKVCKRRTNIRLSHYIAYMSLHIFNASLGPLFAIHVYSHHAYGMRSQADQDVEHKYDDKV